MNYAKIMSYIDRNPTAVLGTINNDGTPYGAVVYVCSASHSRVCFITKNLTRKYANLVEHPHVSLTFFNERESSTLQAEGRAFVVNDAELMDTVMDKINKVHAMRADWMPPVAKLRAGSYTVIGVELTHARLAEYEGMDIGSLKIFTEL